MKCKYFTSVNIWHLFTLSPLRTGPGACQGPRTWHVDLRFTASWTLRKVWTCKEHFRTYFPRTPFPNFLLFTLSFAHAKCKSRSWERQLITQTPQSGKGKHAIQMDFHVLSVPSRWFQCGGSSTKQQEEVSLIINLFCESALKILLLFYSMFTKIECNSKANYTKTSK